LKHLSSNFPHHHKGKGWKGKKERRKERTNDPKGRKRKKGRRNERRNDHKGGERKKGRVKEGRKEETNKRMNERKKERKV
jgi:hypothetical protein